MKKTTVTLTRRQVAALLEISEAQVRQLDGTSLRPNKGKDGSFLYSPSEVAALLRDGRREQDRVAVGRRAPDADVAGDVAAAAFERFESGMSGTKVVVAIKQSPATVESLKASFDRMLGALTIPAVQREILEQTLGIRISSADSLVESVTAIASMATRLMRGSAEPAPAEEGPTDFGSVVDSSTGRPRPVSPAEATRSVETLQTRRADRHRGTDGTHAPETATPDGQPAYERDAEADHKAPVRDPEAS